MQIKKKSQVPLALKLNQFLQSWVDSIRVIPRRENNLVTFFLCSFHGNGSDKDGHFQAPRRGELKAVSKTWSTFNTLSLRLICDYPVWKIKHWCHFQFLVQQIAIMISTCVNCNHLRSGLCGYDEVPFFPNWAACWEAAQIEIGARWIFENWKNCKFEFLKSGTDSRFCAADGLWQRIEGLVEMRSELSKELKEVYRGWLNVRDYW